MLFGLLHVIYIYIIYIYIHLYVYTYIYIYNIDYLHVCLLKKKLYYVISNIICIFYVYTQAISSSSVLAHNYPILISVADTCC